MTLTTPSVSCKAFSQSSAACRYGPPVIGMADTSYTSRCPLSRSTNCFLALHFGVFRAEDFHLSIERVGVVGAGNMGNGIVHVFARSRYRVVLCDVEQRFLDHGLETITKNLDREVAKNKISAADKAAALGRVEPVLERAKLGA